MKGEHRQDLEGTTPSSWSSSRSEIPLAEISSHYTWPSMYRTKKHRKLSSKIILLYGLYRVQLTTPLPVGSFMTQTCSSARKRYLSTTGSGKGHMVLFCDQFRYELGLSKLSDRNEMRHINVCSVASHCYGASRMQLFLVKLLELE